MFEAVEVEQDDRDVMIAAIASLEAVVQTIAEQHAIGEAREFVVERLLHQLRLHAFPLGDVLDHADHARAVAVEHLRHGKLPPHQMPVFVKVAALDREGVPQTGAQFTHQL